MRQFKTALLSLLLFGSFSVSAGIFGPSDPHECMLKNQTKLKLTDAREVLARACNIGYEDGYTRSERAVGRCIVGDVANLYSYESALKVINKCSKDNVAFYKVFRDSLYRNINEANEISQQRQKYDEIDRRAAVNSSQNGPITIYDSATGTFKYCHKNSGVLTCF